jgi:AraC-like DNA-binding protein
MVVKEALAEIGLHYRLIDLGEVEVMEGITSDQRMLLKSILMKSGLELMDDHKAILIEKIKNHIIEMVHYSEELPKTNFSDFLCDKLNHNYTYLANQFSDVTGSTIERFIILHKIERAKEMLIYDEFTLTEISYRLNYSSVAHLSNQFKKITGLTPTFFKQLKNKK